jgi:hypothetical protein
MIFAAAEMPATGDVRLVGAGVDYAGPLAGFMAALAGIEKAAKRQTVRVWIADLDRAYRRLIAEGVAIAPAALRFGVSGLGSISLTHKTRLISPETMVPAGVDLSGEAAELLSVTGRIQAAVADCLGVEYAASLGRMAQEGCALAGPRWSYPEPQGGPITTAARESMHGGLVQVWHDCEALAVAGVDVPQEWIGDPERLPEGWAIYDEDRSSAYAAEASKPLPAVHTARFGRADCAGGALIEATVDLDGWRGVAFPVRIAAGRELVQIAADRGSWRGTWASPVLDYASSRGAKVTIHAAQGWKVSESYLAEGMGRIFGAKQAHARGTPERSGLTAAMQRAIGRLARRVPAEAVWATSDLMGMDTPSLEAAGVVAELGRLDGWSLVRLTQSEEVPRGGCPVWPAFVVARAWVSLCERIEAVRAAGGRPLYCDTDGLLWAGPEGVELSTGDAAGEWQNRGRPAWVWCERAKLYVRGEGHKILQAASSGIPKPDLIWYLEGGGAPRRLQSIREQAAARQTQPKEIESWAKRRRERAGQARPKLPRRLRA